MNAINLSFNLKLNSTLKALFYLLLLLVSHSIQAQNRPITGRVSNEENEPLPGVNILIGGTTSGTVTDVNGEYRLNVPSHADSLIFSFIGYAPKREAIGDRTSINVVMADDVTSLSEVVVVGYGTQEETSLTSSISTLDGESIAKKPVADISNSLGGRVSGIIFTQGSGEPGSDGSNIMIRGRSTTGNTAPLVIVDGIQRDYTRLDPNSIASITVLKDAAAVAPYGMAGANGVILVTTREGKKGAPSLSYDSYVGWQNPTILTEFANSYQYATLFNMANDNAGQPHRYTAYDLQKYKDGTDPIGHPDHNVLNELINKNALITNHNLSLSGGGDKINYYVGLNFLYQAGMWDETNVHQYNLLSKIDAEVTNTTNITLSLNGKVQQSNYPGVATGGAGNIFSQAFRTPPIAPLVFENGLAGEHEGRTVYGQIHDSGFNKYRDYVLYNQLEIEQELPFIKGLKIKGVLAYDLTPTFKRIWQTPMPYYTADTTQHPAVYNLAGNDGPAKPTYMEVYSEGQAFTYQGHINYFNTFGRHEIGALVVFESRNVKYSTFDASRTNYNVNIPELNTGSSDPANIANSGNSSESKQRSVIYRLTYNYDNKYLIETSGRYDGNYYFAPGHRFGFFPAVSIGWRLSEENFMKDQVSWIDRLKIRASYGESGALAGSPFQYLSSYNLYGNSAVINGTPTQGIYETLEPNREITWERAKKFNIGLDATLLKGLINLDADYFYERRNNMLSTPQVTVPFEYGIGIAQVNGGEMDNRGIELMLGSSHEFNSGLQISFTGNFTYARNKLIQVYETPATFDNPNRRQTGRALGTKFGYKALGYFQTDEDANGDGIIDESEYGVTQPWGTVHPGDLKYQDTNEDGQINESDIVPIGNPDAPEIIYGFSPGLQYKGFDLNILFQGAANRDFYIADVAAWPFTNASSVPRTALDVWTPDNPHAANPRVTPQPATNNTQYSSWWVHKAGYLRLKSGELGYTLPSEMINKIKIQSARIYVSCQNLVTWSPLKNFDPEISDVNGLFYPQQRVVSVGLNLKF